MTRSILIFSLFALATILVIVLQPGPRPEYAYENAQLSSQEASRNTLEAFNEHGARPILTAPDDVISNLKAGAKSKRVIDATDQGTSLASPNRVEAALGTPLNTNVVSSDALQPNNSSDLRAMSWQTLNALNGLGRGASAPGQEGSLLSSIVRRSMGQIDGSAPIQAPAAVQSPNFEAIINSPSSKPILQVNQSTDFQTNVGQNYIVASGDTLALIAIKLYGTALATDELLIQNPELRRNPNALRIGQVLKYQVR